MASTAAWVRSEALSFSHGLDLHSPHAVRKGPARGCRAVRTAARFFFVTTQRRTGTLLRECG